MKITKAGSVLDPATPVNDQGQWLRDRGIEFDVVTDFDLHSNRDALAGRSAVIIAGHSEYWSTEAQAAVEEYLDEGGDLIVVSGNTMFWRVSYDRDMAVMECRKHALAVSTGAQVVGGFGAAYHSDDIRRGGLLRNAGNPGSAVIGMEPAGYGGPFTAYTVVNAGHFLYRSPHDPMALR